MSGAFSSINLHYLFGGLGITIIVSLISIIISFVVGLILGVVLYEDIPYFSRTVRFIVNTIRNLPLLLLIFFTYFALPKLGIELNAFAATVVAMSVFEATMVAEIIRGGLLSIGQGQKEGALSTGMTNLQTLWYIELPQALKRSIPPLISQFISLVKDTSLATAIVLPEMMFRSQVIYGQNPNYMIPMFILVAALYFMVNYSLSLLAKWFDRRMVS
ncbi:glutamine ABC transporter permease [Fructilactobacillus lindneri]|uniref:Glutamine ABC transporter permease glnP n=2 Tax=Fructilactobacillus lindneri TaxID=53444 RepID=A0A0R2JM01_9LACO|nr:amino acid ABC transporter permease [Fructilactobacillus lindneri]ANZ57575.1 glutamine ABC transporter permease [Fructilactobacillus lindneri]ANZ58844.1 glutamine ABC transporter permease [Fructilactobacillus lindneri]KRN78235.1 glutamine ABC transporter permease glnP [Fructilactobacillus lindneri DSM 20690 = JCM 11027]POG97727.1 glutamine ABC transporter permease [Fructilactobacillus lindneri]POH00049.1 glutamine ABC transporter permease [Fructilactobacillus lindneri]